MQTDHRAPSENELIANRKECIFDLVLVGSSRKCRLIECFELGAFVEINDHLGNFLRNAVTTIEREH